MTHDVIPASGCGSTQITQNYFIGSPETQVQVSGIVLENSVFLRVFIQACGEGQIVAVMARFFGIMKTA